MLVNLASQETEMARCSRLLWRKWCLEEAWRGTLQGRHGLLQGDQVSTFLSTSTSFARNILICAYLLFEVSTYDLIHPAMPSPDQQMEHVDRPFVPQ